eukprot:TRINITY_DN55604_c0_g1_i1.p1 TRINITY_DN55604_c0_g1~~TRINITY_DN55604_c0_g1_i1.p1  ORF type:complete len:209 (+),score=27.90 TRINITY_DN55604_c0_g1_i1:64-627(+)
MVPVAHCQQLFDNCINEKTFVSPAKMHHNEDLLRKPEYCMNPLREFLADAKIGSKTLTLSVPSWAFDKQMCPQYLTRAANQSSRTNVPCCTVSTVACPTNPACSLQSSQPPQLKRMEGNQVPKAVLEATIARAVEHSFQNVVNEAKHDEGTTAGPGAKKKLSILRPLRFGEPTDLDFSLDESEIFSL